MKQQKMIAKQIQKGVKFYYKEVPDLYHDKKTAYDIDVDDNVKELIIPTDLKMNNTKKSFPSVKKLIINALVVDIQIPNSLFPNVKRVVSKSKYFDTCFEYSSVLMRNTFGFWTLLNTFCKEEGEEIDLQDVIAINDFAFQGCKSTRIKSPDMSKYVCAVTVAPNAFTGSAFENAPFVDGVKMAGNIVIGIDNSADTVVIPDSDNQDVTFASNVVCSSIKKIIVHSPDTVSQLGYTCGFPETLVLKTDLLLKEEDVAAKAHEHINDNYIKHFSIVNPGYKEIDGIVYTNNEEKLVACSMEKEHVVIPDGVKTIGSSAFANCMIKSVIIPDSVTEIRGEAFKQCQNLESVIFGKNVKIIGRRAFSQCYNIKHLSMPEGLRIIRNDAFAYSGLESIKLNEGLKKIGENVFFCTNIKSIRLPETIKCIEDKCLSGSIENVYIPIFLKGILDICAAGTYHPDTNLVYASSYRVILENVFSPDENDVIDMSGINKIASYAFHGCKCTNLINLKTTFTWPDIEESAFVGSAFEAQTFVNGVKMVNYIVIDIDKDADKVVLPDTMAQQAIFLQDIDLGVVKEMVIHNPNSISNLQYNSNLPEKLTLEIDYYIRPEDILMLPQTKTKKAKCIRKLSIKSPHYVEIDGIIYTKDMHRLIVGSAGLKHVEVPEGVEKITDFAFYNSEIESVKLPDSIKKIGDEAFSNCHNLKEVNLGNGVQQLGNYVFSWDENLTKIELPQSLQEVGAYSFYKSNIKSITLNEGLSNIIQGAFAGTYIEKVYIPGSVKKICDEAFSTCHNLKEINFGNGVQQLGNYVFSWNEKLTKIELPPSLQEVGGYAFYKSNIKSITLNEGLSNIVQGAFVGTHIEKLYIPGSVKHIGKGAISENTKEIIMPVFLEDILQGIRRTEKINHFDHTSHIVRLQCGDKYAYLPRYVDISKFADLTKTVTDFFTDFCEERPELWKYAEDTIDKEDLAILEYYDFNAKEAKEYLKRNAKIFALRLIQNKDEERLAKLLKMNIASNQLLKLLLEEAGEMPTARAYILEMLGNTKTNKSFSI